MVRTALKCLGWMLLTLIGAILVYRVVFAAIPASTPKPSWVSSSGKPTPPQFLYAMFPRDGAVPLCDSPNGNQIATLGRAVINSQKEIDAGGWVSVYNPSGSRWVQLSNLDLLPPANASVDYFASFVSEYRAWNPDEYRNASLEYRRDASDTTIATLQLWTDDEHWQEYVYQVSSTGVVPLEMYSVFGPALAFADMGRFFLASFAAIGFLGAAGLTSIVVLLRKRAARKRQSLLNT